MTTLTEAYDNLRTTILKHRDHVDAITKRQFDNDAQKTAVHEVHVAYSACFNVISGGKSRALLSDIAPLKAKRAEYLREARKLNTALNNLVGIKSPAAVKAAATRKAAADRLARIKSIKRTWVPGEFSIVKTAWESGYDQDYSHQLHLFQGTLTLEENGVTHTFPCFKSTTGLYFPEKDIDSETLKYGRGTNTPKADFVDGRLYL